MTEPRPTPAHAHLASASLLAALVLVASACHTWRPAPVDLAEPAWTVTPSQAVWHPARREVELAGDLLLAVAPDGRGYLQFGKGPVVIAEARAESTRWLAGFPASGRTFSGPGDPPGRLAWNQLLLVALGRSPAPGWTWTGSLDTRWRLVHERSGEWIEGTRLP